MSAISCPQCQRKMSSNAAFCSRCGYAEGEISEEQRIELRQRLLRDRMYHLRMISYAVITVFVGGFGWFWWSSGGFQSRPTGGPFILMGLSGLAYMVVRALLFRTRQNQRSLRRRNY